MNLSKAGKSRHHFVDLGIVLHGARLPTLPIRGIQEYPLARTSSESWFGLFHSLPANKNRFFRGIRSRKEDSGDLLQTDVYLPMAPTSRSISSLSFISVTQTSKQSSSSGYHWPKGTPGTIRAAAQRCKRLFRFRARRTNSLKNGPEKQDSSWDPLRRRSHAWWAREALASASRRIPLLPRRDINTVDARVHNV